MAEEESLRFDESDFPNGLRVLSVDDSVVCLRIVTKLLQKCGYQVTPKVNSAEALMLLRQNENHFDIVLTNVHMHEIDGFKLLEAGLELDIPVIMVSASDSKEIIMKGIRYGARDYLLKPLRVEELKNIWQHVYRKKLPFLVSSTPTPAPAPTPATTTINRDMKRMGPKRKVEGSDEDEVEENESRTKKERVRWTEFLHNKFVDAVSKLGGVDKAVPKKILEMMGEPDITREKVASHLQKYRKIIKKRSEIEGQELNTTNHHHHLNHHNNHHLLLPPPLPHPITLNHHHPSSSIANNNSMLMGPTMRGIFAGPTMANSNYQRQQQLNNLLVQQHGGYPQQPLQVVQNQGIMMQQPRMHLDNGNSSFGVSPNNSSLLTQFNNQHHNYHHNPPLNNQDIKVQLPSSDCFDYNELVDLPSASDQPPIVDPSYDFYDGICPSLLDELI